MLIVYVQYAITGCLPLPTEPMLNRVVHAKLLNNGMKLCKYLPIRLSMRYLMEESNRKKPYVVHI